MSSRAGLAVNGGQEDGTRAGSGAQRSGDPLLLAVCSVAHCSQVTLP